MILLMKKKSLLYVLVLVTLIFPNISYAEEADQTNEILKSQEEAFGISDFIKETEKYAGDTFQDISIQDMINSAITGNVDNKKLLEKVLSLLGSDVVSTLKTLISILVIVLIHSVLKSITEGIEESEVSKIIYYVQYILIVTIIMSNFSGLLGSITDTINNLTGFANTLIPLLVTLMTYTGSITTSSMIQPILLFIIEFIGNIIRDLIMPIVSIIVVISIVSKVSDRIQIEKISKFMKSSIVWFLGIILTVFVGVLSLEGTLTASVDGITAKTAKAAVSSLIPVVGKVLGDGVDTILGCGVILKNAVGLVGTIVVIGICIVPIIKLATFSIMYSLLSAVIEPIADGKIVKLLDEFSGVFKLLLAILCSVSFLLIIGITLVIKISNSGMMYR